MPLFFLCDLPAGALYSEDFWKTNEAAFQVEASVRPTLASQCHCFANNEPLIDKVRLTKAMDVPFSNFYAFFPAGNGLPGASIMKTQIRPK